MGLGPKKADSFTGDTTRGVCECLIVWRPPPAQGPPSGPPSASYSTREAGTTHSKGRRERTTGTTTYKAGTLHAGRAGEEVGREREGTIAFPSFPFLSSRKQGNTHKEGNEIEGHHPPSFTMNQNTTTTMSRPLPR